MARILIVSAGFSLDHHAKDLGVVRTLLGGGHDVKHLLIGDGIQPGYPKAWVDRPEFRSIGSVWRRGPHTAVGLIAWAQVVVVPNARGVSRLSQLAHALGRTVVQHDNLGGLDFYFYEADYAAIKGDYFRELIERADEAPTGGYDEVPLFLRQSLQGLQRLAPTKIEVTGCVQFDAGLGPGARDMTRDRFCKEYDLDPDKRIAVWLPDGAQNQDAWSRAKYVEICKAVEGSRNHNLIIKMHPNDYLRRKSDIYLDGRRSADILYPQGKVCRPEHKYDCFRHCDVGLTILSTVCLEFPLFRRPIVFVDSEESPIVQKYSHFRKSGIPLPGVVGAYCRAQDLTELLESNAYEVRDRDLFDEQVRRFSHSADGRSHERVAALVERAARETPAERLGVRHVLSLSGALLRARRGWRGRGGVGSVVGSGHSVWPFNRVATRSQHAEDA